MPPIVPGRARENWRKLMAYLVGMNPSRRGAPPLLPCDGDPTSAASRLLKFSGLSRDAYLEKFKRLNVMDGPWQPNQAKREGLKIRRKLIRDRETAVILGRNAWWALGLPATTPWFGHFYVRYTRFILIPHPSGKSLIYNDPEYREQLRVVMQWA